MNRTNRNPCLHRAYALRGHRQQTVKRINYIIRKKVLSAKRKIKQGRAQGVVLKQGYLSGDI